MNYEAFIGELKALLSRAKNLFDAPKLHENQEFKRWKKELVALLFAIEEAGYDVQCNVISRSFTLNAGYGPEPSAKKYAAVFNDGLQDTINEMEIIIDHCEKFGIPRCRIEVRKLTQALDSPEKVTLAWLWNHLPIHLWTGATGILITAFLLGISFGHTLFYKNLVTGDSAKASGVVTNQEPESPAKSMPPDELANQKPNKVTNDAPSAPDAAKPRRL